MTNLQGVAFAKETICAIDSSYSLTFEKLIILLFPSPFVPNNIPTSLSFNIIYLLRAIDL